MLRKGCLALVDNVREARAAHATSDQRLKIALEASNLGFWEWDLTTGEVFVDHIYFGFLGLEKTTRSCPWKTSGHSCIPKTWPRSTPPRAKRCSGTAPLFQLQHRMRHADGRWVWLETYGNVTQRDADRPRRCA